LDHSTPSALSEVLRNEAESRIRRALVGLPEKHRIVLVLRYYNRMSYSQVASALNLPLSAVRVRIFRAKRFLRSKLRRPHRGDNLARIGSRRRTVRKAEHTNDMAAINSLRRFKAPVSADIETLPPMPASSGFYIAGSSAGARQSPC
jgi:hypothetical protein